MKLILILFSISISYLLKAQTLSYNHACILRNAHVKTERHYLVSTKNDTILKQQNNYDINGNRVSSKAFFLTGEPGDSDTAIYDTSYNLIQRIVYSPLGKIMTYNNLHNNDVGQNISISAIDTRGRLIYKDTSVYDDQQNVIYTAQLTNNKDYPKMKRFFYNNQGALEKEVYVDSEKDSTIIIYTYTNDVAITDNNTEPAYNKCKKVSLPDKVLKTYSKPKNGNKKISEELFYYSNGLLIRNHVSGIPERNFFDSFLYYTFYD